MYFKILPLEELKEESSSILKIINKNKKNYFGIDEVYCSTLKKDIIKAWKKHKKMISNILVIKGSIKFVFFNDSFSISKEIILNEKNKKILHIRPNVWFGFKGLSINNSLINFSNIVHDETEIERKAYNGEYTNF